MTSVLIIEDEGDFGRALAVTLVNAGFEIGLVSSAAETRSALAVAAQARTSLLIGHQATGRRGAA